jgi:hypothetical protein
MSKQILVYDINSVPSNAGLDMDRIMYLYNEHQLVIYSSRDENGEKTDKPQVLNVPEGTEMKFIDSITDAEGTRLCQKL